MARTRKVGIPSGGTTGQVLKKTTAEDYATEWGAGGGGGGAWGSITGTLSAQTDLQTALNLKANIASPTFTGTPTAPTAAVGTNTTQLATTEFVQSAITNTNEYVTAISCLSNLNN